MTLFKKMIRDIMSSKGQFVSITIVIFLGAFFFTGLSSGSRLLTEYSDSYYSKNNLSDLWLYYSNISEDELSELNRIEAVEDYELRFTFQTTLNNKKLRVHSFDENSSMNELYVMKGKLPETPFEIAVDNEYGKANKLGIGDDLDYVVDGKTVSYTITAFIESPEYVTKIAEDGNGFPEHDKYGIAYVHYSTIPELSKLTGIHAAYDELLIKTKTSSNRNSVMHQVAVAVQNDTYLYGYTREMNPGISSLAADIEQFESLSIAFPVVFFFVAMLMTYLAMRRIIDIQKVQIGIMKALGVNAKKIALHYMAFPIVPSLVGSLLGGISGSLFVPQMILYLLKDTYDLPGITSRLYLLHLVPILLVSILLGMIGAFLSCRRVLRLNASTAMRPTAPKAGHHTLFERFARFWSKLSCQNRMIVRNITGNKLKTILSCLGLSCSVALLITGFAMYDSTEELIDRTYSEIYNYDAILELNYFTSEHGEVTLTNPEELKFPNGVSKLSVPVLNFETTSNSQNTKGTIRVLDNNSDYFKIMNSELQELASPTDGFIISRRLANQYNLKVNDTLTVKLTDSFYGGKTVVGTIRDISEQYLTQDIYCTPSFLENQGVQLNPLTVYVNFKEGMTASKFEDFYKDDRMVSSITSLESQRDAVEIYTQSMVGILLIMIFGAMLLSFAVIYNISLINIMERRIPLATMKVLGYKKKRIMRVLEYENLVLAIMGIIVGIPLGLLLMRVVFDTATTDSMSFPYVIFPRSIIFSCILTILFTILSCVPLHKKIKTINMIEILKQIE